MSRPSGLVQILVSAVIAAGLPCCGASVKGAVEGRVLDAHGNPVSGATVQIGHPGEAVTLRDGNLYCGGAGLPLRPGGASPPDFIQDIPLGENDPCGAAPDVVSGPRTEVEGVEPTARYVRLSGAQQLELRAWGNRKVLDLHTATTDSQGHYRLEAPAGAYEMVAFRPVLGAITVALLARGNVAIGAGQTANRDMALGEPALSPHGAPPGKADWPILYEGPVNAGGAICVDLPKLVPDLSVSIALTLQPPMNSSDLSIIRDGSVQHPVGKTVSSMTWTMSAQSPNVGPRTFKIAFLRKAADARVQALSYDPATGYGPARVALCK